MLNRLPAFLSCQGKSLNDQEKKLFAKYKPVGVCLFSRFCENVENAEQLEVLTREIKEVIGQENVLIAVDQEGGRVRRLPEPEFAAVAAQEAINTPQLARQHAYLISHDLQKCGINVNFAPVLDIITPATSQVLQGRCFLENHAVLGKAMVDEYIKNGICPCIKHLPGHGRATSDPHLQLPVVDADLQSLQEDFAPFAALNDCPMGMVAHIVLTAVDKDKPATISQVVIQKIIREQIGFKGLLVSDAIVMRALQGSIAAKAQQALAAGCDIVCLGNADFAANQQLCESEIKLSDAAGERLQRIYKIIGTKHNFADYINVKNNYCTSVKNIVTYNSEYDATEVLTRLRQQ